MPKIAIVGNPNSGKTTVYNYLTGENERVGNWMGVTVSAKNGNLKRRHRHHRGRVEIIDLPGTYTMEGYTKDECVSIDYIEENHVDAILNVIDMSQLERSLVFTLELINLNIPMVIALNKRDVARKNKITIDIDQLRGILNEDIIVMQASKNKGIDDAIDILLEKIEANHESRT
jgi:ferrous iron transport protein B